MATTTSMTPDVPAARTARSRAGYYLRRQLAGFVYSVPTLIFVVVLFVTPLVLAARMSLSTYGLLTGPGDFNFPKNFAAISRNQLFWPAVWFTVKYTVVTTAILTLNVLSLVMIVIIVSFIVHRAPIRVRPPGVEPS